MAGWQDGGAVFGRGAASSAGNAAVSIDGSTFTDNAAQPVTTLCALFQQCLSSSMQGQGGAVYVSFGFQLYISQSVFSSNTASQVPTLLSTTLYAQLPAHRVAEHCVCLQAQSVTSLQAHFHKTRARCDVSHNISTVEPVMDRLVAP